MGNSIILKENRVSERERDRIQASSLANPANLFNATEA
jgi:hypothetical protein